MHVNLHGSTRRTVPIIIGFAITVASCSSSATTSTPTTSPAPPSTLAAGAATTVVESTTTATTVAAATTTTVPFKPIGHGELWDLVDGPALLTRLDGTTALARFGPLGALPITGTFKGVDMAPIGTAANIVGTAWFESARDNVHQERWVQMYLTAAPEGATTLLAEVAPAFADESAAPLATAVEGGRAFETPFDPGRTSVQLSFARGPVFVVIEIAPNESGDTASNLTVAESIARATAARIETRLTTCGVPCRGVAGDAPKWPPPGRPTKRPVGTCEDYAFATPDFRPPATLKVDVPCSQEHDVEYITAIKIADLAARPNNQNLVQDFGARADCEEAVLPLDPGRRFGARVIVPIAGTPERIAAGDTEVVCVVDDDDAPGLGRIPAVTA